MRIAGIGARTAGIADTETGQPHHLLRRVQRCTFLPLRGRLIGVGDHRVRVRADPRAVKSGLHQPTLAQVKVTFARQQAVTEKLPRALEAAALGEIPVVSDEDVANILGVVDEKYQLATHPVRRKLTVRPRNHVEEVEWIAREPIGKRPER